MIEQATIITGTPQAAQEKLREFLASHTNATVLSSSIRVSHTLAATLEETNKPASKAKAKAKAKEADEENPEQTPTSESPTFTGEITMPEHLTVCIIAGIKL